MAPAAELTVNIDLQKCPEMKAYRVTGTIPALAIDSRIQSVKYSCGCMSSSTLIPGGILSGRHANNFEATLDFAHKAGAFSNQILVELLDQGGVVVINLNGNIVPRVDIARYLNCGDCVMGDTDITRKIKFIANRSESIKISRFSEKCRALIKNKGEGCWELCLTPNCSTIGEFSESIYLGYSLGEIPINVSWSVRDPKLKEAVTFAGFHTVGEQFKCRILLSGTENGSLSWIKGDGQISISNPVLVNSKDGDFVQFDAELLRAGALKQNFVCELNTKQDAATVNVLVVAYGIDKCEY